jgi:SAM-dependent methyltransferase
VSRSDPFAGTAEYYANFRPGLPLELVQQLILAAGEEANGSLLDLGTGTGQVPLALQAYFSDIIAVDQNAEMVRVAQREMAAGITADTRCRVVLGRAEAVVLPRGWKASLVTIGRAFHWMDQGAVLGHIEPHVRARGVVALFNDNSLWNGQLPWQQAIKRTIQDFLGDERRAGVGLYNEPQRSFEAALESSAFSSIERTKVPYRRTWKPETILGLLYSSSFSARQLYGDRVKEFETALHKVLHEMGRKIFVEEGFMELTLGRRPDREDTRSGDRGRPAKSLRARGR